jgi:hypothetical protein
MVQDSIFLPFLAMGLLTFIVLGMIPQRRFAAAARKEVTADDFALGESPSVPAHVSLPNRNYMNLLEVPTLFYAVCLALYVTDLVSGLTLGLAWAYVAGRTLHSLVHVTYNKVMHRLILFAGSNFILMALWAVFAVQVWPSAT